MFLHLKRAQRFTWLASRRYSLTVYVECDAADRRILARHRFGADRVYTEPRAQELANRAVAAFDRQDKLSLWRQEDHSQIIWENLKGLALAVRARTAFHVRIDQLLAGTVVECRDMAELLEVEATIIKAFDVLKRIIDNARAFETGREMILAPDDDDEDSLAPPSTWPRYSRR